MNDNWLKVVVCTFLKVRVLEQGALWRSQGGGEGGRVQLAKCTCEMKWSKLLM